MYSKNAQIRKTALNIVYINGRRQLGEILWNFKVIHFLVFNNVFI